MTAMTTNNSLITSSGICAGAGQTNDSRHWRQGTRLTCSSGCQWLFNGEMRSPSTALSTPSKRRCGLTCLLFNILYPREFSTEGQIGLIIIIIIIIVIMIIINSVFTVQGCSYN